VFRSLINLVKNEPAAIVAVVQTAVALIVTLGFRLTTAEAAGIVAFTAALLAAIPAVLARPVGISAITGLVTAGVTLLIAFGVPGIHPGVVASLNAAIVAVLSLVLRWNLTTLVTIRKRQAKVASLARSGMSAQAADELARKPPPGMQP
jgi:hypothetical protein